MKAVEMNHFSWRYEGHKDFALEDICLEIEENEFIGVIGPNEAGKTTLVNAIKGIIPENYTGIYRGEVKVFGELVINRGARAMAQAVGVVFADPESQFNSMSVEEEISFGMENIGCSLEEIKKRLEWVDKLTNIGALMEKPPYNLSGGQKQRIAIASVLAMQPKIIILDEPTSMLDPVSKDMVFDLLRIMKQELNLTIIVVEHNIEKLVELSDKMILVNNHKIEKYAETGEFFKDLDFIERRNVRVPGAVKFMHMVDGQYGKNDESPIKLEDIEKTLASYMDGMEKVGA
ncbi:MAG: energy-coupling factor ABC transporter ATP-binding protein [Treponema sp.]|jgi:energy-coupling factor transport system ATP-binding protein|nr:energy-coupling factor ABC transporter ATP-binding protein [Treponema sp.]